MSNRIILVVEKDEGIREIIKLILEDQGFKVKSLNAEEGAIEMISAVNPCAIILDIIEVTAAGTALCELIKQHPEFKHIPVIVLSTHPKAAKIKDICADKVMAKPFDIEELLAAVEHELIK